MHLGLERYFDIVTCMSHYRLKTFVVGVELFIFTLKPFPDLPCFVQEVSLLLRFGNLNSGKIPHQICKVIILVTF